MLINRDTYREIKKMDHKQMDEYLRTIYMRGYSAGVKSTQKQPDTPDIKTTEVAK